MKPLLLRLDMSIKWLCKQARHSEVTKGRMLERGKTAYLAKETVPRSVTVERADSPCKSRNSLLSGGFFFSVVQHVCMLVLFSCVLMISWMELMTSLMGFLFCPSQTRPFNPRTPSPNIALDMGMRKVRQVMSWGTQAPALFVLGSKCITT